MAVLVAFKTWGSTSRDLEVRSDSAVALASACQLKSRSQTIFRVVLEASLKLYLNRYKARAFVHIPGVTNVEADALSRLFAPDPKVRPASLPVALEVAPVNHRAPDFWRTQSRRCAVVSST